MFNVSKCKERRSKYSAIRWRRDCSSIYISFVHFFFLALALSSSIERVALYLAVSLTIDTCIQLILCDIHTDTATRDAKRKRITLARRGHGQNDQRQWWRNDVLKLWNAFTWIVECTSEYNLRTKEYSLSLSFSLFLSVTRRALFLHLKFPSLLFFLFLHSFAHKSLLMTLVALSMIIMIALLHLAQGIHIQTHIA